MVVQGRVAQQGLLQILRAVEVARLEHIADAAIEALHHAIGFGRTGLGQAVLNTQLLAQLGKLVGPRGLAFTRGKQAVRELFSLVGQQSGNLERANLVQRFEGVARAGSRFVFFLPPQIPNPGAIHLYNKAVLASNTSVDLKTLQLGNVTVADMAQRIAQPYEGDLSGPEA